MQKFSEVYPASKKVFQHGKLHPDIRVPMREVKLTNNETIQLYDSSGPYTTHQQS